MTTKPLAIILSFALLFQPMIASWSVGNNYFSQQSSSEVVRTGDMSSTDEITYELGGEYEDLFDAEATLRMLQDESNKNGEGNEEDVGELNGDVDSDGESEKLDEESLDVDNETKKENDEKEENSNSDDDQQREEEQESSSDVTLQSTETTDPVKMQTVKASVGTDGRQGRDRAGSPSIDGSGRYVAFSTSSSLEDGITSQGDKIYVRDLHDGTTELISKNDDGSAVSGNQHMISPDGRYVVYRSNAFFSGAIQHVFLYDRETGEREFISGTSPDENGERQLSSANTFNPSVSENGEFIVFESTGNNLVGDGGNSARNIFIWDRSNEEMARIEIDHASNQSANPKISSDGNFIVFESSNADLTEDKEGDNSDIFLYNRNESTIERITRSLDGGEPNGNSRSPDISRDGSYIVFGSTATDLVDMETSGDQIYRYHDGEFEIVSIAAHGRSGGDNTSLSPAISGDGKHVSFRSGSRILDPNVRANGFYNVYVRDMEKGQTQLIQYNNEGELFDDSQTSPTIDDSGTVVAFTSWTYKETNIVPYDTNRVQDVYVTFVGDSYTAPSHSWDGDLEFVPGGNEAQLIWESQEGFIHYYIFQDGELVDYVHGAENEYVATGLKQREEYEFTVQGMDRYGNLTSDGPTESVTTVDVVAPQISYIAYDRGILLQWDQPSNGQARGWTLYRDGEDIGGSNSVWREYFSDSDLEPDTEYHYELKSRDWHGEDINPASIHISTTAAGEGFTTELISQNTSGEALGGSNPAMTDDGSVVAFASRSDEFLEGDSNDKWDVFVRDGDAIELISIANDGSQGDGDSDSPSISADGSLVAFRSNSINFHNDDSVDFPVHQIYIYSRTANQLELITQGIDGNIGDRASFEPVISGNGRFVVFQSTANNLIEDDTRGYRDIFIYDRETREIEWVNRPYGDATPELTDAENHAVSYDGSYVVFETRAKNLIEGGASGNSNVRHIYLWERETGEITQVSKLPDGRELTSELGVRISNNDPDISDDGRYVVFHTYSHLPVRETSNTRSIQRWDRETGELETVSYRSYGNDDLLYSIANIPNEPKISGDGRFVLFRTADNFITPVSPSHSSDILYVRDMDTGRIWMTSVSSEGVPNVVGSLDDYRISRDGSYITYSSTDRDLIDDRDDITGRNIYRTFIEHVLEPPTWPEDAEITVTQQGQTFVALSWDQANGTVAEYQVRINGDLIGETTSTNYTVTNLEPGTEYTFTVEATGLGETTPPLSVTASTIEGVPGEAGLIVTPEAGGIAQLSWDPAPQELGVIGYQIQRRVLGEDAWENRSEVAGYDAVTAEDTGLLGDTAYEYRVLQLFDVDDPVIHTSVIEVETPPLYLEEFYWNIFDQPRVNRLAPEGDLNFVVTGEPNRQVSVEVTYDSWYGNNRNGGELLDEPEEGTRRVQLTESSSQPGLYEGTFSMPKGAAYLTGLEALLTDSATTLTYEAGGFPIEILGHLTVDVQLQDDIDISDLPDTIRIRAWSDSRQDGASLEIDHHGTFVLENLPQADDYVVRLQATSGADLAEVQSGVQVHGGLTNPVDDDSVLLEYRGPSDKWVVVTLPGGVHGDAELEIPDDFTITVRDADTNRLLTRQKAALGEEVHIYSSEASNHHLNAEELEITVSAPWPGQSNGVKTVEVQPGEHLIEVEMPESDGIITVYGTITNSDGEPVEGVEVSATHPRTGFRTSFNSRVKTTEDGTYALPVLPGKTTISAAIEYNANHRGLSEEIVKEIEPGDDIELNLSIEDRRRYVMGIDEIKYVVGGMEQGLMNLGGSEAEGFSFTISGEDISTLRASRSNGGYPIESWLTEGTELSFCIDGSPLGLPEQCQDITLGENHQVGGEFYYDESYLAGSIFGQLVLPDGSHWNSRDRNTTSPTLNVYDESGSRVLRTAGASAENVNANVPEAGEYRLQFNGRHDGTEYFADVTVNVEEGSSVTIGNIEMQPGGRFGFRNGNTLTGDPEEVMPGNNAIVRATYDNTRPGTVTDTEMRFELPQGMNFVSGTLVHNGDVVNPTEVTSDHIIVAIGDVARNEYGSIRFQISVNDEVDSRDTQVRSTIQFTDVNDEREEWIGNVEFLVGGVSLTMQETIHDRSQRVHGRAPGNSTIRVYADSVLVGETMSAPNGFWQVDVDLPERGSPYWYTLNATATNGEESYSSPNTNVLFHPDSPRLVSVSMRQGDTQEDINNLAPIAMGNINRFLPATSDWVTFSTEGSVARFPRTMLAGLPFEFELNFSDPDRVSNVHVYVEGPAGGNAPAEQDEDGVWRSRIETDRAASWRLGKIYVSYDTDEMSVPRDAQSASWGDDALALIDDPIDFNDDFWGWGDHFVPEVEPTEEDFADPEDEELSTMMIPPTSPNVGGNDPPRGRYVIQEPLHLGRSGMDGWLSVTLEPGHSSPEGGIWFDGGIGMVGSGSSGPSMSWGNVSIRQPNSRSLTITVTGHIPIEDFLEQDRNPIPPVWREDAALAVSSMDSNNGNLVLNWHPAEDSLWIDQYRIYEIDDDGGRHMVTEVFGDNGETELTNLNDGELYTFQVAASDPHGNWSYGPELEVTVGDLQAVIDGDELDSFMALQEELVEEEWKQVLRMANSSSGDNRVRQTTRVGLKVMDGLGYLDVALAAWEMDRDMDALSEIIDNFPECAGPVPPDLMNAIDRATLASVGNSALPVVFATAGALAPTGIGLIGSVALVATGTASALAANAAKNRAFDRVDELLQEALEDAAEECEEDPEGPPGSDNGDNDSDSDSEDGDTPSTDPNGRPLNPGARPIANPAWKIDPSGFVYEVDEDNRLQGVTATVLYSETENGPYEVWDAEWWGEQNPQTTDAVGWYGWDVPEGWWRVVYEKDGYETTYSEDVYGPIQVPPPHFEVNIPMRSILPPEVEEVEVIDADGTIAIAFNRHVRNVTVSENTVQLLTTGDEVEEVAGEIVYIDSVANPHTDSNEKDLSQVIHFVPDEALTVEEEYELVVRDLIESYSNVPLTEEEVFSIVVTEMEEEIELVSIELSPTEVELEIGETESLTVTAHYSDDSTDDKTEEATWSSSDEGVATVNENGVVTGVSEGTAVITFTFEGESAEATVTVKKEEEDPTPPDPGEPELTSVQLSPSEVALEVGKTESLTVTAHYNDDSTEDKTEEATWSSSDESVVIVNENGIVTAISEGTAIITATFEGETAEATVTVKKEEEEPSPPDPGEPGEPGDGDDPPSDIRLFIMNGEEVEVAGGEKVTIKGTDSYIVFPEDLPEGSTLTLEEVSEEELDQLLEGTVYEIAGAMYRFTFDNPNETAFGDSFTLAFSYDTREYEKEDVHMYHYDDATEQWTLLDNSEVDEAEGIVSVKVNSFSIYGVLAERKVEGVPKAPEDVEDEEKDPDKDKDSTDPKDDDKSKEDDGVSDEDSSKDDEKAGDGDTVPDTATNMYNMLIIGLIFLAIGTGVVLVGRRRKGVEEE
ncbi:Ig-like domain-containing protein [Evansella sp. AB-P1]|uniref:fibronectin type III domain-containing protein n=1 Tax=Evansella sp. AB-P1 TaxID=3037653 RepID=UPI00241F60AD|nr:fibronectin type III domain-containing protein [Evansella sp. AB-P1]MDG5786733.1 Ig-like domain-containing protein [Evansella sp. AB-P1]